METKGRYFLCKREDCRRCHDAKTIISWESMPADCMIKRDVDENLQLMKNFAASKKSVEPADYLDWLESEIERFCSAKPY